MVTRSINRNDYGVDEIIDVVDISFLKEDTFKKVLPGKMFTVQLKSSKKDSKSHSIKFSTINYLYNLNIPSFLVKINIKTKKYKYANINKQIRENWSKYKEGKSYSLELSNRSTNEDEIKILKRIEDNFKDSYTNKDIMYELELDYLLTNASLLMASNKELERERFELDLLMFLDRFKCHLDFLVETLSNDYDLGVFYEDINSYSGIIITLCNNINDEFRKTYRMKGDIDRPFLREGLIYQEMANMYVALMSIKGVFDKEKDYWIRKYGYILNNIMPDDLINYFNKKLTSVHEVVKKGDLINLIDLL